MERINYTLRNSKNEVIGWYNTREEAEAAAEKAAKRGWVRTIHKVEWKTKENPEIWELEGGKEDPTKIEWGNGEEW